jgi:squalene-hopene/tetraprenyl-beta-curcumene cyclase
VVALSAVDRARGNAEHEALREGGLRWLAANQNHDGGWGDTTKSKSNISTTALCWAALGMGTHAERYLEESNGHLAGSRRRECPPAKRIAARYGKDRTFSVPILMHLRSVARGVERGAAAAL